MDGFEEENLTEDQRKELWIKFKVSWDSLSEKSKEELTKLEAEFESYIDGNGESRLRRIS